MLKIYFIQKLTILNLFDNLYLLQQKVQKTGKKFLLI